MARTGHRLSWYDWVLAGPLVLYSVVFLFDLYEFTIVGSDQYPIGWEPGGWTYRTETNYIIATCIHLVVSGAPIILYAVSLRKNLLGYARSAAAVAYAMLAWLVMSAPS